MLTNRLLGVPIFVGVLALMYSLSFVLGKIPQDWIADGFKALSNFAGARLPAGELTSLLVDGVIPGVSAVIVFVPVIMILMGCIAFLEDTGYMARAAFIMDRLMHVMGLHGKSFIPLIMGSGCNVPAIQAARTIESPQDRLITMLVTPLVSCSARLQVFIVIAGTFFTPFKAALAIIAMHFLGLGLAVLMGRVLRSALFSGPSSPFVMELPPYRLPTLKATLIHMWEKGSIFLTRAGTTIFAGATLVWFLSRYPGIANRQWTLEYQQQRQAVAALNLPPAESEERLKAAAAGARKPDREHEPGGEDGPEGGADPAAHPRSRPQAGRGLEGRHRAHRRFRGQGDRGLHHGRHPSGQRGTEGRRAPQPVAGGAPGWVRPHAPHSPGLHGLHAHLPPCLGTIAMIRREAGGWRWAAFTVGYGLVLGWGLAWVTVAIGRAMGFV